MGFETKAAPFETTRGDSVRLDVSCGNKETRIKMKEIKVFGTVHSINRGNAWNPLSFKILSSYLNLTKLLNNFIINHRKPFPLNKTQETPSGIFVLFQGYLKTTLRLESHVSPWL